MKTVSHVSVKIDCDGVKKGEGRRAQTRRSQLSPTGYLLCSFRSKKTAMETFSLLKTLSSIDISINFVNSR